MTANAKTRKAQERARKRALGLVKLELWLPPALHDAVRQRAEELRRSSDILPNP